MKFFVSYSRSVQDQIREVIASLRDSGEEVWWDQDLRAGQDWWGTILNNIEACEIFLFMISEKAVQSPYCMDELRYALARNRLILPYVIDWPPSYTIPPEIMQGRIQYEPYSGTPSHLKHRIRMTCEDVDWSQYRNRYAARPPEPNTGTNDLVDRLDKAVIMASEGYFDEAIKGFKDVSRNDPTSYRDFCDNWIDKISRYRDVVKHANVPALKSLAKQRWGAFLREYANDDFFDPLNLQSKLLNIDGSTKRSEVSSNEKEMTPEKYFEQGLNSLKHDLDQAIMDYSEAIRLNPSYADAYNNRGKCYYAKKAYNQAIADYSEAIRLNPSYADARYNRGLAYAAQAEHELAIIDYSEAIRLNPSYADAYHKRGVSYYFIKHDDQAIADYDMATYLNPDKHLQVDKHRQIALEAKRKHGGWFQPRSP